MSCFDKLKRLKDEVNRLFHEGLDENAVLHQLRTNEQFADARYEQVQVFYSYLQKKSDAEEENKRKITEKDQQIEKHGQQVAKHEQKIVEHEQKIAEHVQQIAEHQQMKTEMESMVKYGQYSNKFLIYDESFDNWIDTKCFWQGRFLMTVENKSIFCNVHTIKVHDLFQDTTKSFTVHKAHKFGHLFGIYALKFPFVLLLENITDRVKYFSLAMFNFESESLPILQLFKFNAGCQILLNALDTSKFLLQKENDVNECNLVDGKIQIGKKVALESDFDICRGSYFGQQLCGLQFRSTRANQLRIFRLIQVKMLMYDLERNKHSTQDLDSTPENFHCLATNDSNCLAWMRDTVFIAVEFHLTRKYGVIFTNPQIRNWKVIEFAIDLQINHIQTFVDETLMIYSGERQNKKKIYKLQMRKPDFLRNMAWTAIVKLFKEAKINNPYEEARKYLPLNSEIQPFVFAED